MEEVFAPGNVDASVAVAWELVGLESKLVVAEAVRARFEVLAEGE